MKKVALRTKAWFGDREERFSFPDGWDVAVCSPRDAAAIDDSEIRTALANPIGTAPLVEIARGKKTAAIIVDDLSRPTPTHRLAPFVLDELRRAGVPDDGITFIIGGGTHRPLTGEEIAKKLGADVARSYQVLNHDAYSGTLEGMGNLDDGTPLYVNEVFARADVKVALAGIYPHPSAGLGGGAKMVLPGVAGISTVAYNHGLLPRRGRGLLEREGDAADQRESAENAARRVGLDMIVNAVVNSRREAAGLFVGDVVEAYQVGARFACDVYETPIAQEAIDSADIVLTNAYPQDTDPVQVTKSIWPLGLFKNSRKVVINAASDGILYHGLMDRMDYGRFLRLRQNGSRVDVPREVSLDSKDQMVMFSEGFAPEDFYRRYEGGALFSSWDTLIGKLERVCPRGGVVVIPCAPIQLPATG